MPVKWGLGQRRSNGNGTGLSSRNDRRVCTIIKGFYPFRYEGGKRSKHNNISSISRSKKVPRMGDASKDGINSEVSTVIVAKLC